MPASAASSANSLTHLIASWHAAEPGLASPAFSALIDACYQQLHRMATARVRASGAISLSPTEVLHEAILAVGESPTTLKNGAHFLATMSLKMRTLLVDHARANLADKRGGAWVRVTLSEVTAASSNAAEELILVDQAFQHLDREHPRCAQVMHLSYFAGMERETIAKLLDISIPTVGRDLRFGRAFATDIVLGNA